MKCTCRIQYSDIDAIPSIKKCPPCTATPDLYEACAQMRDQHAMLRTSCVCMICEAAKKAEVAHEQGH